MVKEKKPAATESGPADLASECHACIALSVSVLTKPHLLLATYTLIYSFLKKQSQNKAAEAVKNAAKDVVVLKDGVDVDGPPLDEVVKMWKALTVESSYVLPSRLISGSLLILNIEERRALALTRMVRKPLNPSPHYLLIFILLDSSSSSSSEDSDTTAVKKAKTEKKPVKAKKASSCKKTNLHFNELHSE